MIPQSARNKHRATKRPPTSPSDRGGQPQEPGWKLLIRAPLFYPHSIAPDPLLSAGCHRDKRDQLCPLQILRRGLILLPVGGKLEPK